MGKYLKVCMKHMAERKFSSNRMHSALPARYDGRGKRKKNLGEPSCVFDRCSDAEKKRESRQLWQPQGYF